MSVCLQGKTLKLPAPPLITRNPKIIWTLYPFIRLLSIWNDSSLQREGLSTTLPSSSQPFPKKQTYWSSFISWCGSLVHTKGGGAKTSCSSIRLVGIILTWEETLLLLHAVISASTAELNLSRCLCWPPECFLCRNSKVWSHSSGLWGETSGALILFYLEGFWGTCNHSKHPQTI